MRRTFFACLLLALTPALFAITVERVDEIRSAPNPSAHNDNTGSFEVGNGGTPYFDDNAATGSYTISVGAGRLLAVFANGSTTATITFYDDADGTCSSNQMTPTLTVASATVITTQFFGMDYSQALCMLVGVASDAEIAVTRLP